MTTPSERAALKEAAEKATPDPHCGLCRGYGRFSTSAPDTEEVWEEECDCAHALVKRVDLNALLAERDALVGEREDLTEILRDLVMLDAEEWATGGGPGFKDRREKAWARARERFEP